MSTMLAAASATDAARDAVRLWLRLLACTTLVERELRGRLRTCFDTTLARFDALAQLDAAEANGAESGMTMSELSSQLMVTNGNVTSLVERLVADRLVTRSPSPTDGRAQLVRLTARGRRAFASMAPEHHRWLAELFGGLTSDERDRLHALLDTLKTSLRTTADVEAAR